MGAPFQPAAAACLTCVAAASKVAYRSHEKGLLHPYSEDHLLLGSGVQSSTGISASCVCALQEGISAWFHPEILKAVRLT